MTHIVTEDTMATTLLLFLQLKPYMLSRGADTKLHMIYDPVKTSQPRSSKTHGKTG